MRTRHQRQLAEQAGVAPSPPHALTNESRPKRTRNAKASAADPSSSQPQPAAQSSSTHSQTSTRTGRTTQRGRARGGRRAAQPQINVPDDAEEVSDASTQLDASAQSDVSAQAGGITGRPTEDVHGEIPTSPSDPATHPVSAAHGSPQSISPPRGLTANVGISRSTFAAQPVRGNGAPSPSLSATHPVSTADLAQASTPTPQHVQQKSSPSETSLLFSRILSSPVTLGTLPPQDVAVGEPPGLALVESPDTSPASAPPTQAPQESPRGVTQTSNAAGSSSQVESDGTETGLPDLSTQQSAPQHPGLPCPSAQEGATQLPHPPTPQLPPVRGLPANHDKSYSLMHTTVDMYPPSSRADAPPRTLEHVAMAIPTEHLPFHYLLAAKLNPEMSFNLKTDPIVARIHRESQLTDDLEVEMIVHDLKRKRAEEQDEFMNATPSGSSRIEKCRAISKTSGSVMRRHFAKMAADRRRAALEESGSQTNANQSSESNPSPRKRAKTTVRNVAELYDENGNLTLGKSASFIDNQPLTDQNPYVDDEVSNTDGQPLQGLYAESQDQVRQQQVPQTPRSRGWGLTSFLPSVQSVSKFIPFSSHRTSPAAVASSRPDPVGAAPTAVSAADEANYNNLPSTPQQPSRSQPDAQTEPQQDNSIVNPHTEPSAAATADGLAKRRHTEKPKKQLLTKGQVKERDRLKKEKEELRALKERLEQEEARLAQEKKDWEEQRARVESAQTPGTKRKRVPSPDVIPLPPGGGFGLHPDYFTYDSSEEESEGEQETPTRPRSVKRARLDSSGSGGTGDPMSASPYEGGHFVPLDQSSVANNSNVFRKDTAATSAGANQNVSSTTPSAPLGKFAVPSPSDSDDDEATVEGQDREGTPTRASSAEVSEPSLGAAVPSQPTAPPPTSNPSDTTLPPEKILDPVQKARQKALQHQPKFGSRLRDVSRLSTSSAGSDVGVVDSPEKPAEKAGKAAEPDAENHESEYDPRRPALLPQFAAAPEQAKDKSSAVEPTTTDAEKQPAAPQQSAPAEQPQVSPFSMEGLKKLQTRFSPDNYKRMVKAIARTAGPDGEAARTLLPILDGEDPSTIKPQAPIASADAPSNTAPQAPSAIAKATSTFELHPGKANAPQAPSAIAKAASTFELHPGKANAQPTPADAENEIKWAYPAFRNTLSPRLQAQLDNETGPHAKEELNEGYWDSDFKAWKQFRVEYRDEIVGDRDYEMDISAYEDAYIDDKIRAVIDSHCTKNDDVDVEEFTNEFKEYSAASIREVLVMAREQEAERQMAKQIAAN